MFENLACWLMLARMREAAARHSAGMAGAEAMPGHMNMNMKLTLVVV